MHGLWQQLAASWLMASRRRERRGLICAPKGPGSRIKCNALELEGNALTSTKCERHHVSASQYIALIDCPQYYSMHFPLNSSTLDLIQEPVSLRVVSGYRSRSISVSIAGALPVVHKLPYAVVTQ